MPQVEDEASIRSQKQERHSRLLGESHLQNSPLPTLSVICQPGKLYQVWRKENVLYVFDLETQYLRSWEYPL